MNKITDYLQEKRIKYYTEGENTSKGWIEIKCLWCPDTHRHLGINIDSGIFHCWRCGQKGSFVKLVSKIEKVSFTKAQDSIKDFGFKFRSGKSDKLSTVLDYDINYDKMVLDPFFRKYLSKHSYQYLEKRGFDPLKVWEKYKLQYAHWYSEYHDRIIIPIVYQGKVVSFTGRDITDKNELRYKTCPENKSIINPKDVFYNIDTVKTNRALLVEGPTDVWRMGDGTIACLGTGFTDNQVRLLIAMRLETLFIMFDSETDAQKQAKKLASKVSSFIPEVEIIELNTDRDPGDLTDEEAKEIRVELGLD